MNKLLRVQQKKESNQKRKEERYIKFQFNRYKYD